MFPLAKNLSKKIDREWEIESKKANPSFGRALWNANKSQFPKMLFCQLYFALIKLLIPISLGLVVDWFADMEQMKFTIVSAGRDF